MASRWLSGIISSFCDGSTRRTFFISTPEGVAVVYPRVHKDHPDVRLGAYVRIMTIPPPKQSLSMEVDEMILTGLPKELKVKVDGNEVKVLCYSSFIDKGFRWLIFHNEYLGRLAKKIGSDDSNLIKSEKSYRVMCRRVRKEDRVPSDVNAHWLILNIEMDNRITVEEGVRGREDESEKRKEEMMESGGETRRSVISIMRRMLKDENVCRVFEEYDETSYRRIVEICNRL